MRYHLFLPLIISLCFAGILSGCASVQTAGYEPEITSPTDASPAPIMYSGHKLKLPIGEEVGVVGQGSMICGWPYGRLERTDIKGIFDSPSMRDTFHDALEAQNYDVIGNADFIFDEDITDEALRTEYKIKAHIIGVQIKACNERPIISLGLFANRGGVDGELFLRIRWSVYDNLRRAVVFQTITEGYTNRKTPNKEGITLMVNDAFEMAAHNLATNPEFHNLIFRGARPEKNETWEESHKDRPRIYRQDEKIILPATPLHKHETPSHIEAAQNISVLVQAGIGHGSGFFITKQGHILTNHHVVGNAQRVRIVTKGKEEKLIAEVLRSDKSRDVALLKLEEMPDDLNITPLPIRTDWPAISEEIYAIGAPLSVSMQDTVSKGIISAHRENRLTFGARQDYLQGDITIHGGNSGGILLDRFGNISGLSVAGYSPALDSNANLNLFIPVASALQALDISISGRSLTHDNMPNKNGIASSSPVQITQ